MLVRKLCYNIWIIENINLGNRWRPDQAEIQTFSPCPAYHPFFAYCNLLFHSYAVHFLLGSIQNISANIIACFCQLLVSLISDCTI